MTELFQKVLNMSFSASALVLVVVLLRLLLRKAPKWINVLLWGMVALRLICPFTIESEFSQIPKTVSTGQALSQLAESPIVPQETAASAPAVPVVPGETYTAYVQAPQHSSPTSKTVGNTILPILSILWLLGVIAMLLYTLLSYDRLCRRVRGAVLFRDNISLCESVTTPFVLGIFRPWIYLPADIPEPDIYHVIAHERMHIQRKDHWWKPLGFLLLSIHWFNPLIWLAYALFCRDIELACDERAIKNMCPEQRANYSQALLNCSARQFHISACPLAFGEVGVKDRVKNVLSYKKPAFWLILVSLLLCLIVALCFLTDPKTSDQLLWLQSLDSSDVRYIEYRCYDTYLEKQYHLYQEEALPEAVEILSTFDGEPCGPVEAQSLIGSAYSLTIVERNNRVHTVTNYGNKYLSIDNHFFEDTHDILNQIWDFYWKGTTYLPAEANVDLGVALTVEEVSPTGITLLFDQYDTANGYVLFGGNDYFLQIRTANGWQELPTKQDVIFATESYDLATIRRHKIDWEWLYGTLSDGHYRIGKTIHIWDDGSMRNYGTVYASFTIGETKLQIIAEDVTPTGLTIVYDPTDVLMSSEIVTDMVYWLESHDGTQWRKMEPTQNPDTILPIESHTIRTLIAEPDRHELDWSTLYGALPDGTYRIGISMYFSDYNTQENLYAAFTIENADFGLGHIPLGTATEENPNPYFLTSVLNVDEVRCDALFLEDGGGYTFFKDQDAELVSILNSLKPEDFFQTEGIHSKTTIFVFHQDYQLALYYDGKNVQFALNDGNTTNSAWAVQNPLLNNFFDRISLNSAANSTYEIYDVAPLTEISPYYTLEQAAIDKVVTFVDGDIRHNSEVWNNFVAATNAKQPATLRLMKYYHQPNRGTPAKSLFDLEYDGTQYILHGVKDGKSYQKVFRYLRREQVSIYPIQREYDEYVCYFLTNHEIITLKNLDEDPFTDPAETDQHTPIIVYSDLITYPIHPEIPKNLVSAKLELEGIPVVTITDTGVLEKLYTLLSAAEKQTSGERPYAPGMKLILHPAAGDTKTLILDASCDLICTENNAFYDYGPNTDARKALFSLLGFSVDAGDDLSQSIPAQLRAMAGS